LEPQFVASNDLATLNAVLGDNYGSKDEAVEAMTADKTGAALAIFESNTAINMPEYITEVFDAE